MRGGEERRGWNKSGKTWIERKEKESCEERLEIKRKGGEGKRVKRDWREERKGLDTERRVWNSMNRDDYIN